MAEPSSSTTSSSLQLQGPRPAGIRTTSGRRCGSRSSSTPPRPRWCTPNPASSCPSCSASPAALGVSHRHLPPSRSRQGIISTRSSRSRSSRRRPCHTSRSSFTTNKQRPPVSLTSSGATLFFRRCRASCLRCRDRSQPSRRASSPRRPELQAAAAICSGSSSARRFLLRPPPPVTQVQLCIQLRPRMAINWDLFNSYHHNM
jgi:hypothetical protein